jgi:Ser/Thr protein kinase RdoA (MazF antagonist)
MQNTTACHLDVRAARFDLGTVKEWSQLEDGLINLSFKVKTERGNFVLQRLSSLWNEKVIDDYISVQRYLRTNGLFVPVLLPSKEGAFFCREDGFLWRAFEYVPHDTVQTPTPIIAYEAGRMLGRFHRLMDHMNFQPTFSLEGFHDTLAIIRKLEKTWNRSSSAEKREVAHESYDFIQTEYNDLCFRMSHSCTGIIHGDPKLLNFLFKENKAVALLDLDTMMKGSRLLDIGDALRSWSRVKPSTSEFLPNVFHSAYQGYVAESEWIRYSREEVRKAAGYVTLELSARYLTDYFEESYFPLKSTYRNRAEQNLARCRRYLEYYRNLMEDTRSCLLL